MQTTVSSFLHQRFLAVALVYQLQYQHTYLGPTAGKERNINVTEIQPITVSPIIENNIKI